MKNWKLSRDNRFVKFVNPSSNAYVIFEVDSTEYTLMDKFIELVNNDAFIVLNLSSLKDGYVKFIKWFSKEKNLATNTPLSRDIVLRALNFLYPEFKHTYINL